MKHLTAVALGLSVAFGLVSCSKIFGGSSKKACENLAKQCGDEDFSSKDVDECTTDLAKLEKEVGGDAYDKMLSCTADADSCGEAIGCMAGGMFKGGSKMMENFQKGFDKANR